VRIILNGWNACGALRKHGAVPTVRCVALQGVRCGPTTPYCGMYGGTGGTPRARTFHHITGPVCLSFCWFPAVLLRLIFAQRIPGSFVRGHARWHLCLSLRRWRDRNGALLRTPLIGEKLWLGCFDGPGTRNTTTHSCSLKITFY